MPSPGFCRTNKHACHARVDEAVDALKNRQIAGGFSKTARAAAPV
jgi:hypothetical protein